MRALGIDPGIANLGWAVCEVEGEQIEIIDLGVICTTRDDALSLGDDDVRRCHEISNATLRLLQEHQPKWAAVEEPPYHMNRASILRHLAMVAGIVYTELRRADVNVVVLQPMEIKKKFANKARADKKEMLAAAHEQFPDIDVHLKKLKAAKRQHPIDALGAIVSAVRTWVEVTE